MDDMTGDYNGYYKTGSSELANFIGALHLDKFAKPPMKTLPPKNKVLSAFDSTRFFYDTSIAEIADSATLGSISMRRSNESKNVLFQVNAIDEKGNVKRFNAAFVKVKDSESLNCFAFPPTATIHVSSTCVFALWFLDGKDNAETWHTSQSGLAEYFNVSPLQSAEMFLPLPTFNLVTCAESDSYEYQPVSLTEYNGSRRYSSAELLAATIDTAFHSIIHESAISESVIQDSVLPALTDAGLIIPKTKSAISKGERTLQKLVAIIDNPNMETNTIIKIAESKLNLKSRRVKELLKSAAFQDLIVRGSHGHYSPKSALYEDGNGLPLAK